MRKYFMSTYKHEKGQAVAELAIVLPVFLLLMCAIIDFGWMSFCNLSLSYCSHEGARYGIVHAEDTGASQQIVDRVGSTAPDFLKDIITVSVTFSNPSSPRLGDITVRVSATIDGLTPIGSTLFGQGDGIMLSSECVMKVE